MMIESRPEAAANGLSADFMQKTRVLDVGNCDPDHGAIRNLLLSHFDVEIDRVMFVAEGLAAISRADYALVLVNRLIFADGSEGQELIRRMRADATCKAPVMMVSNFADAQERAVAAGALPGFGKAALHESGTLELLAKHLPRKM